MLYSLVHAENNYVDSAVSCYRATYEVKDDSTSGK